MRGRLGARLPSRIVVPFLLFWCLGSLVLGHELASLPFASIASAVMRPLQATLQVQGMIPGSVSSGGPYSERQQDASQRLTVAATGLLGRKIPVISRARGAKANARSKAAAARRAARNFYVSTYLTQRSTWDDPAENGYAPALGAGQQTPTAFGYAAAWHAFSWDDGDGWNARATWESAGWNSPGLLPSWGWAGAYTGG